MRFFDCDEAMNFIRSLGRDRLVERAKRIRLDAHGTAVTFSKNVTLDLSRACRNACGYCSYRLRDDACGSSNPDADEVLLRDAVIRRRIDAARECACTEVLITSGESPGEHPLVQQELSRRGFENFVEFVEDVSRRCFRAGLLPHTNIGVLPESALVRLAPLNASMGLMLESVSEALCAGDGPHANSPGKNPRVRIDFVRLAGIRRIPFTTGILVGIGETMADRAAAFVEINRIHDAHRHIQEVIIQNFIPKPQTRFAHASAPPFDELLDTVVMGRNLLLPDISVQVAPNLIAGREAAFLHAGVNDFGGISPLTIDVINPAQPWPEVPRLEELCSREGFQMNERLPVYDAYLRGEEWLAGEIAILARSLGSGLNREARGHADQTH